MDSGEVTAALQSSRYNDTVVVHVSSQQQQQQADDDGEDEEEDREILLVPCLDEANGGIIWNDLAAAAAAATNDGNGNSDKKKEDIGIVRHLRTKRWVFPMLNDHRRNELYETAIRAASYAAVRQWLLATNTKSSSSNNNGCLRVLDIGSGTGLLSMLAAKYVKEALIAVAHQSSSSDNSATVGNVHVTSLEMSAAMSRLARLIVSENNMQDSITVLEQHSITPRSEDKDQKDHHQQHLHHLCVSELLESSLLGEGMLPAIRDAWERQLAPNAIVVPQQARVFCQLVEGEFLNNYWGPHHSCKRNANKHATTSEAALSLSLSDNKQDVMLDGGSRDGIILHIHADHWLETSSCTEKHGGDFKSNAASFDADDSNLKLKPLSDPFQVMDFDFSKPGMLPDSRGRTASTRIVPHTSGTAHAVLFWWELDLWKQQQLPLDSSTNISGTRSTSTDRDCTYSMKPGKEPWQDHWHQNLFIFTNTSNANDSDDDMTHGCRVQAGKECELIASHDDNSLWFSIPHPASYSEKGETPPAKRLKSKDDNGSRMQTSASTTKGLISPLRACQLNNHERERFLRRGIAAALKCKGKDALVLDVSDFSLGAILAALEGATRVSSLESSTAGVVPNLSGRVAQLANRLPRDNNVFQILQCYAEQLSLEILNGAGADNATPKSPGPVEIIVAEPYYEILEGWHLQEALNYYYLVQALRRCGVVSKTAMCVPSIAIVRGCAVQSFQLRSAYKGCGQSKAEGSYSSKVCGFDHEFANHYGDRFHTYDISLPIWEYDYVELTESFEIATFSYEEPCDSLQSRLQYGSTTRVPFKRAGVCHGMIVWIDYGVGLGSDSTLASVGKTSDTKESAKTATPSLEFQSTLGRSYRQLVRMIADPVTIPKDDHFAYEFSCRATFGNQNYLESHTFDLDIQKCSSDQ